MPSPVVEILRLKLGTLKPMKQIQKPEKILVEEVKVQEAPVVDQNAVLRSKLDTLKPTKQIQKPEKKSPNTPGRKRGRPKKEVNGESEDYQPEKK